MVESLEMAVVLLLKYPEYIFLYQRQSHSKLLNRRVAATKLNGFAVATAPSVVNRTAGGLIELAKSELDEAILACRRRSIDARRSEKSNGKIWNQMI